MLVRHRLLEMLSTQRPLTVVSAPAGYGKTVLVESWAGELAGDVTLVRSSLDDRDLPAEDLLPSLVEALQAAGVAVRAEPPGETGGGRMRALAADVVAHGRRVVWVLDCGELSLSSSAAREVDRLIRKAGGSLAVLMSTREDPPLPLHRYRLEGALCEVRAADLAFTASEVAAWMDHEGVTLTAPQVSALRTRTGGWPVGLRFASMSLRGHPDVGGAIEAFRGDTGNVAEYLMSEVLARQTPRKRRFLLGSCIVEELDPPLVEQLTGQHCDVPVLEAMANSGCFVERIPGQHDRFRYHALFRQFLRAQLWFEASPPPAALHRVAAEWLAGSGQTLSALRHAVAAEDWLLATRVLVDSLAVVDLLSGARSHMLRRLMSGLPAGLAGAEPALTRAAMSLADLDASTAGQQLAAARTALAEQPAPQSRACTATVAVLTALQLSLTLDTDAALDRGLHAALVAEVALRLLPDDEHLDARAHLAAVVAGCQGRVLFARGDFAAARDALRDGLRALGAPGLEQVTGQLRGMSALVEAAAGHLRQAAALAAQTVGRADEVGADRTRATSAAARLALAWVRIDEAEQTVAHELIRQAEREPAGYDAPVLSAVATLLQARLLMDRGDVPVALAGLRVAEVPVAIRDPDTDGTAKRGWLRRALVIEQADALRRLGRPRDAVTLVRESDDPARPRDLDTEIALQRALMAAGDPGVDLTRVSRAGGPLARGDTALTLEVGRWLVLAEGAVADHDLAAGTGFLDRALRLAARDHLRRPILEAPPGVRALLADGLEARNRWLHARPAPGGSHELSLAIPEQSLAAPVDDSTGGEPVVVPLTTKEREVLGYLARLLTTEEMAAVMFVSVNTVRTHVRNILRKLGVSRRNEAVRRAWDLRLLPPETA